MPHVGDETPTNVLRSGDDLAGTRSIQHIHIREPFGVIATAPP
ncbi:MAG: hypothetical protein M0020_04370 [Actinomycetota bacterium]|nr:hypothetical protein [Actinomycetota bacterium]